MTSRAAVLAIIGSALDAVERFDPAERDEIFGALRADLESRLHGTRRDDDDAELQALADDRVARLVARRPRRPREGAQ